MLHLAHEVGCMIERRSRRHAHLGEHEALILIRQETAGQANEQQSHDRRDRAVDQEHSNRSRDNPAHMAGITVHVPFKHPVEPAKKAAPMLGRRRGPPKQRNAQRSEEHTSELQSLMRNSYAVFCLKKKKDTKKVTLNTDT